MEFGYQYRAYNQSSELVSGVVYADSDDSAYAKLKRAGLRVSGVKFSLVDTLNGLSGKFDTRELVRFYRTIGARLDAGKDPIRGMEAAISFTSDPLLLNSLRLMHQRIMDGTSYHDAMTASGFNERDSNVIRAAAVGGAQGQAFLRLALDVERAHRLRSAVRSTFLPMKILAAFAVIGTFAAMGWLSPKMIEFFDKWAVAGQGASLPKVVVMYNKLAVLVAANKIVAGTIFGGVLVGGGWLLRSPLMQSFADRWRTWRQISEKSDQAAAWTSFSLLLGSGGVSPYEAAAIAQQSCHREDTRRMFEMLDKSLQLGTHISEAVKKAGFPRYIVSGVLAAEEGAASIITGLDSMVEELEEDVEVLTGMLKIKVQLLSQVFGGLVVMLFFYVTLFPIFMQIGQKI